MAAQSSRLAGTGDFFLVWRNLSRWPKLSDAAKILYLHVWIDDARQSETTVVLNACALAANVGKSPRTIGRNLKELVEAGLLDCCDKQHYFVHRASQESRLRRVEADQDAQRRLEFAQPEVEPTVEDPEDPISISIAPREDDQAASSAQHDQESCEISHGVSAADPPHIRRTSADQVESPIPKKPKSLKDQFLSQDTTIGGSAADPPARELLNLGLNLVPPNKSNLDLKPKPNLKPKPKFGTSAADPPHIRRTSAETHPPVNTIRTAQTGNEQSKHAGRAQPASQPKPTGEPARIGDCLVSVRGFLESLACDETLRRHTESRIKEMKSWVDNDPKFSDRICQQVMMRCLDHACKFTWEEDVVGCGNSLEKAAKEGRIKTTKRQYFIRSLMRAMAQKGCPYKLAPKPESGGIDT